MKKLIVCFLLLLPMVMQAAPWEEIAVPPWRWDTGSVHYMYRTPTPHGWLVLVYSGGVIHIPDENHEWVPAPWEAFKALVPGDRIFRTPVPHGWLVCSDSQGANYFPDENHEWDSPQSLNKLRHDTSGV